MNLFSADVKTKLIILKNNVLDVDLRFRLMDLGLYSGANIEILDRKKHKKNMLVVFNSVEYMLDNKICELIEVEYA